MPQLLKSPLFLRIVILTCLISVEIVCSQSFKLISELSVLEVHGTSTLHDWQVDAEKQRGMLKLDSSKSFSIKTLCMFIYSNALESGKSGMNKDMRKALKAEVYDTIDFNLLWVDSLEKITAQSYQIVGKGQMTIRGIRKLIPISFLLRRSENQVTLEGEKIVHMTDYNIEPPKALFGVIKTDDEIKIVFKSVFQSENL